MVMLKVLVLVFAVAFVKAEIELSPTAKKCVQDVGISVDTVKRYAGGNDLVPEDNKVAEQFFSCAFDRFISDTNNQLIVDDRLKNLVAKIYKARLGESTETTSYVNDDINTCSDVKGESKGLTAIKVTNCLKQKIGQRLH